MHMSLYGIKKLSPVLWKDVDVNGGLLGTRQQINHSVTIPIEYKRCEETGRIESLSYIRNKVTAICFNTNNICFYNPNRC